MWGKIDLYGDKKNQAPLSISPNNFHYPKEDLLVRCLFFRIHPDDPLPDVHLTRKSVYGDIETGYLGKSPRLFLTPVSPVFHQSCNAIQVPDVISLVRDGEVHSTEDTIVYYGKETLTVSADRERLSSPLLGAKVTHFHVTCDDKVKLDYSPETGFYAVRLVNAKPDTSLKITVEFLVTLPRHIPKDLGFADDVQALIETYSRSESPTSSTTDDFLEDPRTWQRPIMRWKNGPALYRAMGLFFSLKALKIVSRIVQNDGHIYLEIWSEKYKCFLPHDVKGYQNFKIDYQNQPNFLLSPKKTVHEYEDDDEEKEDEGEEEQTLNVQEKTDKTEKLSVEDKIALLIHMGFSTEFLESESRKDDIAKRPLCHTRAALHSELARIFSLKNNIDYDAKATTSFGEYLTACKNGLFLRFKGCDGMPSLKHTYLLAGTLEHAELLMSASLAQDPSIELFQGENQLSNWAHTPPSPEKKLIILALKNVDLEAIQYADFEGIYHEKPSIRLGGKQVNISHQHRIIVLCPRFISSQDDTVTIKYLAKAEAGPHSNHMNRHVYFAHMASLPAHIMFEHAVYPIFAGLYLTTEELDNVTKPLANAYKHDDRLPIHVLKLIVLLARAWHARHTEVSLSTVIHYQTYCVAKHCFKHEIFETFKKIPSLQQYDHGVFKKYRAKKDVVPFYQDVANFVQDMLILRQWRTHKQNLSDIQRNGHLILQTNDEDVWETLRAGLPDTADVYIVSSPVDEKALREAIYAGKLIAMRDISTDPLKQKWSDIILAGKRPDTGGALPATLLLIATTSTSHKAALSFEHMTLNDQIDKLYRIRLKNLKAQFDLDAHVGEKGLAVHDFLHALHVEGVNITRYLIATEHAMKCKEKPQLDALLAVAATAHGHQDVRIRRLGFALCGLALALGAGAGICLTLPAIIPAAIVGGIGLVSVLTAVGLFASNRPTGLSRAMIELHAGLERQVKGVR